MTIFSICGCTLHDTSADPSSTSDLRDRFWKEARMRWRAVKDRIRQHQIIIEQLASPTLVASSDKVGAFQVWLSDLFNHTVVADGKWMKPYITEGIKAGVAHAQLHTGAHDDLFQQEAILQGVARTELMGITDATVQQITREVGNALLTNKSKYAILALILDRIDKVGAARTKLCCDYLISKAFTHATLEMFRQAKVTHVGIIPELKPVELTTDAARKTPQKRHRRSGRFVKFTPSPSKYKYRKIVSAERKLKKAAQEWGGEVGVETAEDDRVCPQCEEIAAGGPYSLEEAEAMIPAHPNCRCIFVPAAVLEDSVTFDAGPPDEPRDDHGRWTSSTVINPGLKQYLEFVAGVQPGGPAEFVLKHGVSYKKDKDTFAGPADEQKMCYMNATKTAMNNPERTYVEGYVTVHGIPVEHAWTIDKDGKVYDNTIRAATDHVDNYFGIPFKTTYLLAATLKNKFYGLLGSMSSKTLPALLEADPKTFLADYDPDEPRDDHGRWTSGGAPQPNVYLTSTQRMTDPNLRNHIDQVTVNMGYDPKKVYLSTGTHKFTLNGKEYTAGGVAFTYTGGFYAPDDPKYYEKGDIVIDAKHPITDSLLVHEIEHQKFEHVREMYYHDRDTIRDENARAPESLIYADDRIKPEHAKNFPAYDKLFSYMEPGSMLGEHLRRDDGITNYSMQYWDRYNNDQTAVNWRSAIHETLAEIAAYNYIRRGDVMPTAGEQDRYRHRPSFVWSDYFRKVNELYDQYVKEDIVGEITTRTKAAQIKTVKPEEKKPRKKFDYTPTQKIRLLVFENPSKHGTKAHKQWQILTRSGTVGDFFKGGGSQAYLKWFVERGKASLHHD